MPCRGGMNGVLEAQKSLYAPKYEKPNTTKRNIDQTEKPGKKNGVLYEIKIVYALYAS